MASETGSDFINGITSSGVSGPPRTKTVTSAAEEMDFANMLNLRVINRRKFNPAPQTFDLCGPERADSLRLNPGRCGGQFCWRTKHITLVLQKEVDKNGKRLV